MKSDNQANESGGTLDELSSWASSCKTGVGTAYHTSCLLWYTISKGAVNEIYYPNVDTPNTRDVRFLVSDGETFCHAEGTDFTSHIELLDRQCLGYRIVDRSPDNRYRLEKEIIADPYLPVCMMRCRLEVEDESLRGRLKLYLNCAPRCGGKASENDGYVFRWKGASALRAHSKRGGHMALVCNRGFSNASVRSSKGREWEKELRRDFQFQQGEDVVENSEIELIAEIASPEEGEFVVSIAFGQSRAHALSAAEYSLFDPFDKRLSKFVEQWRRASSGAASRVADSDVRGKRNGLYDLSAMLLLAHEDKICQGAMVASLSIPWGEDRGDGDRGGYHVVWPRDLLHSASSLLLAGHTETARRSLVYLASIQHLDGSLPQNYFLDGEPYMDGEQLDEIAAPILLAWRLKEAKALGLFDPWEMVRLAANYLLCKGPVTQQERWEENAGYSPSTLASIISAMVCAALFAEEKGVDGSVYLRYADWLESHLEDWCATNVGELVSEKQRHYVRIAPVDPNKPEELPNPDESILGVANGGGEWPARNVVSVDFLELVRLGVRAADDPLVVDSVSVIDQVLKFDLPQGPCWLRYNHDGYGQKASGDSFDGAGQGGCWPLLTGERGHYELAAGRDAEFALRAMEGFANEGGMLPEQVWRGDATEDGAFVAGDPIGSATPLCWAHAEYISLCRSIELGEPQGRIQPVYQRYVTGSKERDGDLKVWTATHRETQVCEGDRIFIATQTRHRWKVGGTDWIESEAHPLGIFITETNATKSGRLEVAEANEEETK